MDNSEHINFNAFPFKLRFSNANKIYHEIQNTNEELSNVLLKLNVEMREKTDIGNILKEHFVYIGIVLRKILEYFNSNSCQMESNEHKCELRKLIEDALEYYCEDEQEGVYFAKMKETNVMINAIPASWKCLTWQKLSVISKISRISQINNSNCPDKLKQISTDGKVELQDLFCKDVNEISQIISLINNKIQWIKNRINLLNENIIWLYCNLKEYLKILFKFNQQFSSKVNSNDRNAQLIKTYITKLFDIELMIDFFSNSANAYRLKVDEETICLELKSTDSILTNQNHLNTPSTCLSNQDTKNLIPLNYINEIYIDHNIHYSSNPTTN